MIAEKVREFEVTSTVKHERKIAMSVDEGAMQHIMGILTDLYSDPMLAVVREYSTNAFDAHREAGHTKPIEVFLPTNLAPFFRVKDFGPGLDAEGIAEIYSKYGASTKRQTNDQVGMLGLGCKSALTYTNQFTLVGRKNGIATIVEIGRDEEGAGSMNIVSADPTDDPDGVEVIIPTKEAGAFEQTARNFFRFWEPGTVLVNGKEPEPIEGLRLAEGKLVAIEGHESYVVMGNVAYPAKIQHGMGWGRSLVAYVDIGEVNFPPNRESLMDTPKTQRTLDRIRQDFHKASGTAIQTEIDKATTKDEAITIMAKWQHVLPGAKGTVYTYKGENIPQNYSVPDSKDPMISVPHRSGALSRHSTIRTVAVEHFPSTIWVSGYDRAKFTAGQKKKMNVYAENHNLSPQQWILTDAPVKSSWIAPERRVDWKDIAAIKLPRAASPNGPNGPTRLQGSYDLYEDGDRKEQVPADKIDTKKPLYYRRGNLYESRAYATTVENFTKRYTLVCLPANRIEKFKRDFPSAREVSVPIKAEWEKWQKSLTDDQKEALRMEDAYGVRSQLRKFDPSQIDDPELARAVRIARIDLTKLLEARSLYQSILGIYSRGDRGYKNPLTKYPLASDSYRVENNKKHVYLYVNAVYAATKKEG